MDAFLEYNEFLSRQNLNLWPRSCLTERGVLLFFFSEEEEMFNPTPTVKGKSNAYLTISPVSQRDEIEILMHFRVFPPNGEADRHWGCHIYSMNTHGLMHSTILPSPKFFGTKHALEHKGKGKRTKLFLKLSIKLLHSWQSLKGMSVLLPLREVIILFLSENNK